MLSHRRRGWVRLCRRCLGMLEIAMRWCVAAALSVCLALGGCSLRRFAVNRIGDALAAGGSTFESDEDLELVGDALPFGLKLTESLLA